ncbi:selenocysteine-tRNA-specific elongation factor, partial [Trypanosoma cruzi]
MDFGRTLLQAFRTQLMTASDPNTLLSKQRARLHTAVHEADAFARAARPLAERGGAQRPCDVSGVAFVGARRPHAKPEARPEGINRDADGRQQRRRPHPCRHH